MIDDFDEELPEIEFEYNFSVIYKGKEEREGRILQPIEEFKTSKDEFFRKLRYFKKKSHEFDHIDEVFIHEDYSIEIFRVFIDSIKTNRIHLSDSNYSPLLQLSLKYEYIELQRKIETFCQNRPDIQNIVDNYSFDEIDAIKEEKLAKHLDICLQNENMINFPIPLLNRILNSPKRVINDHHLLFQFIKKVIDKNSNNNDNDREETEENLQILLGALDYIQMSNEELDELFNNEHFSCIFSCRKSKEMIKNFIEERKFNQKRMEELESQMSNFKNTVLSEIENFKRRNSVMEQKIEEQNHVIAENNKLQNSLIKEIKDIKKKNEGSENIIGEMEQRLNKNDQIILEKEIIQQNLSNRIESIKKVNEELESKIREMEQKLKSQAQLISENKIEKQSLNNKIKELEQNMYRKIKGNIVISVQSNQTINGLIKLKVENTTLDTNKSKYLLNQDSSPELGADAYIYGGPIQSLAQEVSFAVKAGTYFLHALVFDKYGISKEFVSQQIQTTGVNITFDFTGNVQSVTLEPGTYKLEVWGAEGGKHGNRTSTAGKGGYSSGILKLSSRTKLFVHVGESPTSKEGGWNGGGSGFDTCAAGGGGATDISLYGSSDGSNNWQNRDHLYSRIIVAGGGGGSARNGYNNLCGGFGGGLTGQSAGSRSGLGGEQTRAGKSHSFSEHQGFGVGGNHKKFCSSGGGGGWYGGSSSHYGNGHHSGGSGGSGYVYNQFTAANYPSGCLLNSSFYLSDASTVSGNTSFPNPSGSGNELGHYGNGYAKITLI